MKLHHRVQGDGPPLVILHGLFGSLENWGSQISALSESHRVIAADLRNHGRSPRSDEMTYDTMAGDVARLLDDLGVPSAHLLGHSMGGKTAMQLALTHPQRVLNLIVVDIAPVPYPSHHDAVFSGLRAIDLATTRTRAEADDRMSLHVDEPAIRAFLLKNLHRDQTGQFRWRMNLDVLERCEPDLRLAPAGARFGGPTLFVKGGKSHYIRPEHRAAVQALFPGAGLKVIHGAGHWPHVEKPGVFRKVVLDFLGAGTSHKSPR